MGRINKTNKANPVSADEFIIYDSEDTLDDKNITLGQVKTFCATDISGKQNLITSPTNNNIVTTDIAGQTKDSGIASSSLTTQGNTFNGNSQLLQLNSSGQLPALDGSLLTGTDKISFALNSGNVDTTGNADLLNGVGGTTLNFKVDNNVSYKPLLITYADKSQENLASLTSITGLSTNGTYTVLKEKGANPVAVSTPIFGKDLFVDFSQGNANDNYGLHTPTIIGSPTFTGGKFNSNGATGVSYPITTLGSGAWCIQGKFKSTNTTTSQVYYRAYQGSYSSYGLLKDTSNRLNLYLSSTGSNFDIANVVVGTKTDWSTSTEYCIRLRFTGTQYLVDWSTDYNPITKIGTWTNDITVNSTVVVYPTVTNMSFGYDSFNNQYQYPLIGTMDDIQVTIGQSACQIKNQVTQGKTLPLYPIDNDYHCLIATGLQSYKRVSGAWVETQYVPIGTATVAGNVISAVTTNRYNVNGYDGAGHNIVESYINGTSWYRIWSDGWIEQGGYKITSTSGDTTFLVPFIVNPLTITFNYVTTYSGGISGNGLNPRSFSNTAFSYYADANLTAHFWLACGY